MKTLLENGPVPGPQTIHQLVKLIAANALPSAARNNSFIVNDVPASLSILADENILATVLSRLVYSVINHAENGCIRISANDYDDIVFIHLKCNGGLDNEAMDTDLQHAQSYAKKMNGNIGLSKEDEKVTGIVFSFPNMHFRQNHVSTETQNQTNMVPTNSNGFASSIKK